MNLKMILTTRYSLHLIRHCFLVMTVMILSVSSSHAQDNKTILQSFAEKIYLQVDNSVYTMDQTIWFKSIVVMAKDHTLSGISKVLHVELVDPDEKIIEQKLIRLDQGIGDGFFQLHQSYTQGTYLLRAYTEWNRNFGEDFFFKKYLRVFATTPKAEPDPIKNITLVEKANKERWVDITIDPLAIDSQHIKDVTVFLSLDGNKDTIVVKKDDNNRYRFDYPVTGSSSFITMQMGTKNSNRFSKTIVLEKDYLDLQFFPESGEWVKGIPILMGFKATDSSGKGKIVEGEIVNSKGNVFATFKSNELGMGVLRLESVDSDESYSARIVTGDKMQKVYPLPPIVARGNVLSVKKEGDKLNVQVISNYLAEDSVLVRVSCRGNIYFDVKGRLRNGKLAFNLSSGQLPDGVNCFTLMTDAINPVAERLYFNHRAASRLDVSVATDKKSYGPREPTTLTISTANSAGPVPASVSLLVVNKTLQGTTQDGRQHILSYLLLNSDLKGEIEKPGFYFTENVTRDNDLDALLLTQGWRKYKYARPVDTVTFQPEMELTVSGTVKGGLFNRKTKKGAELVMMTFGENATVQERTADSVGRFSFILDEFGQDLNILIQSKNKRGVNQEYTITLDKKISPPVLFDHFSPVEAPDSVVKAYVKKNIERKKAEDAYKVATEGVTLSEVLVKSYYMTPERKFMADRYGKPKTVIEGDSIRAKEAKWSYGLYSVLMFNFPDKVRVTRTGSGVLYASLYNAEPTLVVIDGIPVMLRDYNLISSIPPSEVKSFELIEYARNFRDLFCEANPTGCGIGAPVVGNVIAIYTYGGKGIFGVRPAVGVMKTSVAAYAKPREFYAPKYEQLKADDWLKPDLRSLIHWQPYISTDSTGKGTLLFYNADNAGRMQVIVEAITQDGRMGYGEVFYEVRNEKK